MSNNTIPSTPKIPALSLPEISQKPSSNYSADRGSPKRSEKNRYHPYKNTTFTTINSHQNNNYNSDQKNTDQKKTVTIEQRPQNQVFNKPVISNKNDDHMEEKKDDYGHKYIPVNTGRFSGAKVYSTKEDASSSDEEIVYSTYGVETEGLIDCVGIFAIAIPGIGRKPLLMGFHNYENEKEIWWCSTYKHLELANIIFIIPGVEDSYPLSKFSYLKQDKSNIFVIFPQHPDPEQQGKSFSYPYADTENGLEQGVSCSLAVNKDANSQNIKSYDLNIHYPTTPSDGEIQSVNIYRVADLKNIISKPRDALKISNGNIGTRSVPINITVNGKKINL